MDKNILEQAGINYADLMQRFCGNESMMERFLKSFLADENYDHIISAYDKKEYELLLSSAHTLKGVAGNLSMEALFEACDHVVSDLRQNNLEQLPQHVEKLKTAYEQIQENLQNL